MKQYSAFMFRIFAAVLVFILISGCVKNYVEPSGSGRTAVLNIENVSSEEYFGQVIQIYTLDEKDANWAVAY